MRDPVRIEVGQVFKPVEKVRQLLYTVRREDKTQLLMDLFEEQHIHSALVFSRTKSRTERVTKALRKNGFKAKAIHGDRTQKQRQQALEGFRKGEFPILVATDVAARGLDIQGITHVFNYDIPENPDDYIHRIGRTARADAEGDAITFVCPDEHIELDNIERSLGKNIPRADWERSVPVLSLFHPPEDRASRRRTKARRNRARGMLRRR
jgi:ATP-dependent RNA helicase RhlE